MNESEVPEGENMITIFYRNKSDVKGSVPFTELKYKNFDATKSWKMLSDEAENLSQS